jgi:hypothetical protein
MKVAVMQPYIFPYLGYFQLVNAVDIFVFGDDVNYIKGGWISRNKILLNNEAYLLSFPCKKRSQNKLIKDVKIDMRSKYYDNILLTLKHAYTKAPHFIEIFPILETIFKADFDNISDLASHSVITISDYLEINTKFLYTSIDFGNTKGQEKSERLITINKELGGTNYINPIGGKQLYSKDYFARNGLLLNFLETEIAPYAQFENEFIPGLSIIDVLMFNSLEDVKKMLNSYKLK